MRTRRDRRPLAGAARHPLELRLLTAALSGERDPQGAHRAFSSLAAEHPDWDAFLSWTDRHRVAPALFRLRGQLAEWGLPATVGAAIRARFERNRRRALKQLATTARLTARLADRGVPAMPIKGTGWALGVYGDVCARHAGDVDLLTEPRHIDAADAFLREQGYRRIEPAFELTPRQRAEVLTLWNHFGYVASNGGTPVELHWRLAFDGGLCDLSPAQLAADGTTLPLAGTNVRVPSDVDALVFHCVHGATHGWFRLFWLWDAAAAMDRLTADDWRRVRVRARETGALRPLLQAARLARDLFAFQPPPEIERATDDDDAIDYLTRTAARLAALPFPTPLRWEVRRRTRYRARLAGPAIRRRGDRRRLFLHPEDWGAVRLPDSLFGLYYGLGPLLWMGRRLSPARGART